MQISAVIFDLDGTIIDSDESYTDAFKKILLTQGVKIDGKWDLPGGIGVLASWPYLVKKYNVKTSISNEELANLTQKEFLKNLDKISLKKGFEDLANELKKQRLSLALATSNEWKVV